MVPWSKLGSAIVAQDRHFGESGRGNGQFRLPRHICVLPDGNLCVSDSVNLRLQILTPDGDWVQNIGTQGSGPGELRGPTIASPSGPLAGVRASPFDAAPFRRRSLCASA